MTKHHRPHFKTISRASIQGVKGNKHISSRPNPRNRLTSFRKRRKPHIDMGNSDQIDSSVAPFTPCIGKKLGDRNEQSKLYDSVTNKFCIIL